MPYKVAGGWACSYCGSVRSTTDDAAQEEHAHEEFMEIRAERRKEKIRRELEAILDGRA